jgi:hypothetical protein
MRRAAGGGISLRAFSLFSCPSLGYLPKKSFNAAILSNLGEAELASVISDR